MPSWAQQPSLSWYVPLRRPGRGMAQGGPPPPPGDFPARRASGDPVSPYPTPPGPQVNMLIGIIVFNKLMARDGISDKSKKQRAG